MFIGLDGSIFSSWQMSFSVTGLIWSFLSALHTITLMEANTKISNRPGFRKLHNRQKLKQPISKYKRYLFGDRYEEM